MQNRSSIFSRKSFASSVVIFDIILNYPEIKKKTDNLFEGADKVSIDFVFCSDDEIRKINHEYRNIDKETDVITFALYIDSDYHIKADNEIDLGEIIISPETAKKHAKGTFEDEIYTLIAHGILHLLGFDHQSEKDYNFVICVQNYVLEELNNAKI